MYKKIEDVRLIQLIGDYGIVRVTEQTYWSNGKKHNKPNVWYDVCLDHGNGDIVISFKKLTDAAMWAKEN